MQLLTAASAHVECFFTCVTSSSTLTTKSHLLPSSARLVTRNFVPSACGPSSMPSVCIVDKGNRNGSAVKVECLHSWQPAAHVHCNRRLIILYLQRYVHVVPASLYLGHALWMCVYACTNMAHLIGASAQVQLYRSFVWSDFKSAKGFGG